MAGANPLIHVQKKLHSLQFTPYTQSLAHHHPHMHQPTFIPIMHHSSTIPPAPAMMKPQDSNFNMYHPRGTRFSSAPVSTQSFMTKPRRWGAVHVSIAWKIYHHKQLKKMQQKPNRCQRECPSVVSDSFQRQHSEQPPRVRPNLDSPCDQCVHRDTCYKSVTGETSDFATSSGEKEKCEKHKTHTTKDLSVRDKSRDQIETPGLDGRYEGLVDRKRHLERHGFVKVKRVKQEVGDDQFGSFQALPNDPSPFTTAQTHPSSCTVPAPHMTINDLPVLHPNRSSHVTTTPRIIPHPGAETYACPTASWEQTLDTHKRKYLHFRQNDFSLNTCEGMKIPLVAQRQKEACYDFFTPNLYFPLVPRQQETAAYLRGREFIHSYPGCIDHPGFVAKSYLGPPVSRVCLTKGEQLFP